MIRDDKISDVKSVFQERFGFSQEVIDAFNDSGCFRNVEFVEFRKKQTIIHEGDQLDTFYFLISGVVRWYLLDEEGVELTSALIYRNGESVVPSSFFYNMPSKTNIQAITNVRLLKVPKRSFDKMRQLYPEMNRVSIELLSDKFQRHWQYSAKILPNNTMIRYQWFTETHGELIGRINNRYIASYLAMTPATLSRVQKRYRELQSAE